MLVLKWICFIIVCLDAVGHVGNVLTKENPTLSLAIGLIIGILARFYVLYGTDRKSVV